MNLDASDNFTQSGRNGRPWNRAEIERFCDGELDECSARRLAEELAGDAGLRREVDETRELDSLALQALLSRSGGSPHRVGASRALKPLALAAFATVVMLVGWLWSAGTTVSVRNHASDTPLAAIDHDSAPVAQLNASVSGAGDYAAVRVVFSISLADSEAQEDASKVTERDVTAGPAPEVAEVAQTVPNPGLIPTAIQTGRDIERALAFGDFAAAAELLAGADESTKGEVYGRAGALIRSTETGSKVLDRLPGEVAVDVCRVWLEQGTQRPLAIKHLSRLALEGGLHDRVHLAVHDLLEHNPQLRPWMVSYANWAVIAVPPSKVGDGALRPADGARGDDIAAAGSVSGHARG